MDAITQYVKNMSQFGVILGLLLTMGAVAQEKEKGTAAMILVKPLSRGSFIAAKFVSQAVLFAICLVIAGVAAYYYTLLLFEAMNILNWLLLNLFLWVYVLVIVAITLFFSTLVKSQIAAGGMALGVFIIVSAMGSILRVGMYLPGELITWGVRLMLGDSSASWIALGVSLGLIAVAQLAAWQVFNRQEL